MISVTPASSDTCSLGEAHRDGEVSPGQRHTVATSPGSQQPPGPRRGAGQHLPSSLGGERGPGTLSSIQAPAPGG